MGKLRVSYSHMSKCPSKHVLMPVWCRAPSVSGTPWRVWKTQILTTELPLTNAPGMSNLVFTECGGASRIVVEYCANSNMQPINYFTLCNTCYYLFVMDNHKTPSCRPLKLSIKCLYQITLLSYRSAYQQRNLQETNLVRVQYILMSTQWFWCFLVSFIWIIFITSSGNKFLCILYLALPFFPENDVLQFKFHLAYATYNRFFSLPSSFT